MVLSKNDAVEYCCFAMNTEITFGIYGDKSGKTLKSLISLINGLEEKLSRFITGSEIDRINKASGKFPVKVSRETFEILSVSRKFNKITHGSFNILLGTVTDTWDIKNSRDIPEESEIERALNLACCDDLVLNPVVQTVWLRKEGQSIDLGGIGKGYAGDRCMEILKRSKIKSAVINLGGNVCVYGRKPDGSLWRVGIRHPRHENELIGFIEVMDRHVVTSGDYERYFDDRDGIRRHHIMNPITGCPSESGLISVTVISDNGIAADALATSIFAMGMGKCTDLIARFPGSEAVLVDENLGIHVTKGIKDSFNLIDGKSVNII